MSKILQFIAAFFVFSVGLQAKTGLHPEVLSQIPSHVDLQSPQFRHAKQELEELIESCGAGVVEGVKARNHCHFSVKLDELFFQPPSTKTGLIVEKDWAYQPDVTWFEPHALGVPDNFDLKDLMKNGQPEIRKQRCGDCWAWSTHHGLEIARAVHDQKVLDHSIQTVLSCSRAGSCNGGQMKAVDFLAHGLPLELDFPYAASDKPCKYSSSDISTGWDAKVQATPYIGSSRFYSRAFRRSDGTYPVADGKKVQNMMEAMYQWKSPLVVTVSAYSISGAGVYDSCSAINSGGNHMVAISGWEMWNGKRVAYVWNSWGPEHGDKGVSKIVWECGAGKLNRGLGVSAKIVQYKPPCIPPDAKQIHLHQIFLGKSVEIGAVQEPDTKCSWVPTEGLANPNSCVTRASPTQNIEYHLTAENACGKSSSMTLVQVWSREGLGRVVHTPFGDVTR